MVATARTGASRASAPGACRSRSSSTRDSGELHPESAELIEPSPRASSRSGIEAWFELHPADLLGEAEGAHYDKVHDTLDVWFDSGVTHACVLERNAEHGWPGLSAPADLYLEGSDQHRGWFQSSSC
jgi:isoleucyl-tRNA synthetase